MNQSLQGWFTEIPVRYQCDAFSAFRAPDVAHSKSFHQLVRWLRSCCVITISEGHFTRIDDELPKPKKFEKEVTYLSYHYVEHLAEALRVVREYHPDKSVRRIAKSYTDVLRKRRYKTTKELTLPEHEDAANN